MQIGHQVPFRAPLGVSGRRVGGRCDDRARLAAGGPPRLRGRLTSLLDGAQARSFVRESDGNGRRPGSTRCWPRSGVASATAPSTLAPPACGHVPTSLFVAEHPVRLDPSRTYQVGTMDPRLRGEVSRAPRPAGPAHNLTRRSAQVWERLVDPRTASRTSASGHRPLFSRRRLSRPSRPPPAAPRAPSSPRAGVGNTGGDAHLSCRASRVLLARFSVPVEPSPPRSWRWSP